MSHRWARLAPLTGVIAVVLAVLAEVLADGTPSEDAPGDEVIAFFTDNHSSQTAAGSLMLIAAVFLVFFAGALRLILRRGEAHGGLSTIAFAGGVMTAIGYMLSAGFYLTLAEVSDSLEPGAAQALTAMNEMSSFPFLGGLATLLLASGIAIVRGAPIPNWLGWVAIVLGIFGVTPLGFVAVLVGPIWIVTASIVLAIGAEPPISEEPEPRSATV